MCETGSGNVAGDGTGKAGSARELRPWAATLRGLMSLPLGKGNFSNIMILSYMLFKQLLWWWFAEKIEGIRN